MKRKTLLVLLLILAGVGMLMWWERPPRDPVINGVRLSEWLRKGDMDESTSPIHRSDLLAGGPDTAYYLAYAVRSKYPRDFGPAGWLPASLQGWVPFQFLISIPRGSYSESQFAMNALISIYSESEAAKSAMMSLAGDSNDDLSDFAVEQLYQIGPPARPSVLQLLQNGRNGTKNNIFNQMTSWWVTRQGPMGEEELAFFLSGLLIAIHDSDQGMRKQAAERLYWCIDSRSDKSFFSRAIPDLRSLLSDPDPEVQAWAKEALLKLGIVPPKKP